MNDRLPFPGSPQNFEAIRRHFEPAVWAAQARLWYAARPLARFPKVAEHIYRTGCA